MGGWCADGWVVCRWVGGWVGGWVGRSRGAAHCAASSSRWLGVRPAQLSKVSIAPTYLVLESGSAHLEGARGRDGPHGGSSGGGAAWAAEASWRAWGSDAGMGQRGIGAVGTEGERHV